MLQNVSCPGGNLAEGEDRLTQLLAPTPAPAASLGGLCCSRSPHPTFPGDARNCTWVFQAQWELRAEPATRAQSFKPSPTPKGEIKEHFPAVHRMVGGGKHPLGASAGHGVTVLSADSHLPLRKAIAAQGQQAVFLRSHCQPLVFYSGRGDPDERKSNQVLSSRVSRGWLSALGGGAADECSQHKRPKGSGPTQTWVHI